MKTTTIIICLCIATFIMAFVALGIGRYELGYSEILRLFEAFVKGDEIQSQDYAVLMLIRLPRALSLRFWWAQH